MENTTTEMVRNTEKALSNEKDRWICPIIVKMVRNTEKTLSNEKYTQICPMKGEKAWFKANRFQ